MTGTVIERVAARDDAGRGGRPALLQSTRFDLLIDRRRKILVGRQALELACCDALRTRIRGRHHVDDQIRHRRDRHASPRSVIETCFIGPCSPRPAASPPHR
jgi:hypothetical protein